MRRAASAPRIRNAPRVTRKVSAGNGQEPRLEHLFFEFLSHRECGGCEQVKEEKAHTPRKGAKDRKQLSACGACGELACKTHNGARNACAACVVRARTRTRLACRLGSDAVAGFAERQGRQTGEMAQGA